MCQVGTGRVWSVGPGEVVHGAALQDGHAKVTVDRVDEKYDDLPLPVPSVGAERLGEANGSVVQWPEKWIEILGKVFLIVLI